jgi:hypothetical protein
MAIKISGVTVIDQGRNIVNITTSQTEEARIVRNNNGFTISTSADANNRPYIAPKINNTNIFDREITFIEADNEWTIEGNPKIGNNLTIGGSVFMGTVDGAGIQWNRNTDEASIRFYNTADGDTNSRLEFKTGDNGNEYFRWVTNTGGTVTERMSLKQSTLAINGGTGIVHAGALILGGNATGNVDHIWYNDGDNSFYFVADNDFKSTVTTGTIIRAGQAVLSDSLTVNGQVNVTDGQLILARNDAIAPGFELRGNGTAPYIDFSNDPTIDFDARLQLTDNSTLAVTNANFQTNAGLHAGGAIQTSSAKLQVNGFMRTGNINLHEGGNTPNSISKVLSNQAGVLNWDNNEVYYEGNDGLLARRVVRTTNTSSTDNGNFTKIATISIASQFADADFTLNTVASGSGETPYRSSRLDVRVKQQNPFGSDPGIDINQTIMYSDVVQYGYVLVSNAGPTVVDIYAKVNAGFTTVDMFVTATDADSVVFFNEQPFVTSVAGFVFADSERFLTTADEGAGSGLDADTLDGVQGASYLRSDVDDQFTATNLDIAQRIRHIGDTDTYIEFHASNQWRVVTGNSERFEVNNSQVSVRNSDFLVDGTTTLQGNTNVISNFSVVDTIGATQNGLYFAQAVDGRPYIAPIIDNTKIFGREITFIEADNEWTIEGNPKIENDLDVGGTINMNNATGITFVGGGKFTSGGGGATPYIQRGSGTSNYLQINDTGGGAVWTIDTAANLVNAANRKIILTATDTIGQSNAANGAIQITNGGTDTLAFDSNEIYATNQLLIESEANTTITTGGGNDIILNPDSGVIQINQRIAHNGDTNTYHEFNAADSWRVVTGGALRLEVDNTAVTSNVELQGATVRSTGTSPVIAGADGAGTVALTINDGHGNANIAFNHRDGTPDVSGSSARIETSVDGTTAQMQFELADNVTAGTEVGLSQIMALSTSNVTIQRDTTINGTLTIPQRIEHSGDTDTYHEFNAANSWRVVTGGAARLTVLNTGVIASLLTVSTDLVVNGGNITLNGVGRIQGVDTVTDPTDAANKQYVDDQVAASGKYELIFEGSFSNVTSADIPLTLASEIHDDDIIIEIRDFQPVADAFITGRLIEAGGAALGNGYYSTVFGYNASGGAFHGGRVNLNHWLFNGTNNSAKVDGVGWAQLTIRAINMRGNSPFAGRRFMESNASFNYAGSAASVQNQSGSHHLSGGSNPMQHLRIEAVSTLNNDIGLATKTDFSILDVRVFRIKS